MLDFILGFGKILGFVLLGIILMVLSAFIYFKIKNKDENLGFQDFIIDKMSGKSPIQSPSFNPSASAPSIVVPEEEKNPALDVLASIAPDNQIESTSETESVESDMIPSSLPAENATIPDWLKESTSLSSHSDTEGVSLTSEDSIPASEETPLEDNQAPDFIPEAIPDTMNGSSEANISSEAASDLPDWLKGMETANEAPQDVSSHNPTEEAPLEEIIQEGQKVSGTEQMNVSDESMSDLPAWMQ